MAIPPLSLMLVSLLFMAYERIKTEHAGAKNGGGAWMTRANAKQTAKRKRRHDDRREAGAGQRDKSR